MLVVDNFVDKTVAEVMDALAHQPEWGLVSLIEGPSVYYNNKRHEEKFPPEYLSRKVHHMTCYDQWGCADYEIYLKY